jgi:hypothetical protein
MLKCNKTLFFLVVVLAGCQSMRVPSGGDAPDRKELAIASDGGYLSVSVGQEIFEGEFIGARNDSVLVLGKTSHRWVYKGQVKDAILIQYKVRPFLIATPGLLGFLASPFVNGFLAFYSWPFWVLAEPVAIATEGKRENYLTYPAVEWNELERYSRFPSGIPDFVKIADLRPNE